MAVPIWDVHPGKVRLLECVEFAMEFHRGNGASRLLVDLLLAGKTPITHAMRNGFIPTFGEHRPLTALIDVR